MAEEHKHQEKIENKKETGKVEVSKKSPKEKEAKIILEREYIVPLRRRSSTVPAYRRAKKAVRVLKEFIAKHMRVEDRDIRNVKMNMYLNNELWFRGIKKPHAKIKVIAKKFDNGIVTVELADIPEQVKWAMQRDKKREEKTEKSSSNLPKHEAKEKKEETAEEKTEEKEKEAAVVEAGLKAQKQEARQMKHSTSEKPKDREQIHRMSLKK